MKKYDNKSNNKMYINRTDKRYREYIMKKAALVKIAVFLSFVCVGAVVSMLLPLRPKESSYEKRMLTSFPKFTVKDFVDGTYFADVEMWFSDTFPFRDQLIVCSEAVDSMYGIRTNVVHGGVIAGDEIPDVEFDADDLLKLTGVGKDVQAEGAGQGNVFNQMDIDAEDVGTDVEDTDGSTDAKEGESLGSVFAVGDCAYSYYAFSQSVSDEYVSVVNNTAEKLKGKAAVYSMLVPTSIDITLDDATRNSITSSNQQKAIFYMYSRMNANVGKTYVYDALKAHRNEYIYFRTDHHWTADGAYYAYAALMKQLGKETAGLERFEKIEFPGFKGSLFTKTGITALGENPDTIVAYKPLSTNYIQLYNRTYDWTEYNIITDVSGWNATGKYSTFIGGDNPFLFINNPQLHDDSSILIVKESYGNAIIPFFTESFENVYALDYRYFKGTVSEIVDQYNIDTVVFVNNVAATSTQARVDEMKAVCR
ncbi:MAG: DHHW family protein [Eubacteriales bacterium]|nr:DHHW family protein [Eubacteriales bacterium]